MNRRKNHFSQEPNYFINSDDNNFYSKVIGCKHDLISVDDNVYINYGNNTYTYRNDGNMTFMMFYKQTKIIETLNSKINISFRSFYNKLLTKIVKVLCGDVIDLIYCYIPLNIKFLQLENPKYRQYSI